ncbi:MAG TPA: hypothetical protein VHH52_06865 [Pseudonocardiaceae bacterium]|nr:hypothetical protein [Pseudonocardiaceae bacterium]
MPGLRPTAPNKISVSVMMTYPTNNSGEDPGARLSIIDRASGLEVVEVTLTATAFRDMLASRAGMEHSSAVIPSVDTYPALGHDVVAFSFTLGYLSDEDIERYPDAVRTIAAELAAELQCVVHTGTGRRQGGEHVTFWVYKDELDSKHVRDFLRNALGAYHLLSSPGKR